MNTQTPQPSRLPSDSPPDRRPLVPTYLAIIIAVVVVLAAVEAGYRLFVFRFAPRSLVVRYVMEPDLPPQYRRFKPHPYLLYALNEDYRSADGLNRHNALGFRGAEFPREKPPGAYRIACLGGSSTYTTKVDDYRLSYPDQLQDVLRERYGHEGVHVINAGVAGYTSWESLSNLQLRVLDLSPDLVVIYHATNDVQARLVPPERYVRDGTGHRKAWDRGRYGWWDHVLIFRFVGLKLGFSLPNSLDDAINVEHGGEENGREWLARNPPDFFEDNLLDMVAVTRAHGAEIMFSSWAHRPGTDKHPLDPVYLEGVDENNAAVRRTAEKERVAFFDFAAEMPQDESYWADERHVNEKGARRKAELFAEFIETRFLASAAAGSP